MWSLENADMMSTSRATSVLLLFTWVSLILLRPAACEDPDLLVTDSGLFPPEISDVALRFYMTVKNVGPLKFTRVEIMSTQCCLQENSPGGIPDCETMRVLGDQKFNLEPQSAVNLSLVYPTLYIFDRVGACNISINIEHKDGQTTLEDYKLHFDTSLINPMWMPSIMQEWFVGVRDCESVDEDRTDHCRPVNCILKYEGTRNYYNPTTKRCEPAASCHPSSDQGLPDKALKIGSNTCKDLDVRLSEADKEQLAGKLPAAVAEADINLKQMYKFECVHGHTNPEKTGCICDPGWETREVDRDAFNSATDTRQMCDVHDLSDLLSMKTRHTKVLMAVLGGLCGVLLSGVAALSVYSGLVARRKREDEKQLRTELVRMTDLSRKNSFSLLNEAGVSSPRSPKAVDDEHTVVDFASARVHTPNMPLLEGELDLRIGDILTDLRKTSAPGMWKGTCNGVRGTFPVSCAELYRPGQGPQPLLGPLPQENLGDSSDEHMD